MINAKGRWRPIIAWVAPIVLMTLLVTNNTGWRRVATANQLTIAFVPGQTTDPFYVTMERGASAEAKKLGIKLLWQRTNGCA